MALEFEDTETIVMNADMLSLSRSGQYFETAKKRTNCKKLFWWLRCYPNGNSKDGYVSVLIRTSLAGGFGVHSTMTIDRSDIKKESGGLNHRYYIKLATHAEILSGTIIQNDVFVIRCKVNFKIDLDRLYEHSYIEDSCVIKLDHKNLETYEQGHRLIGENQTIDGVSWRIEHYPNGEKKDDDGYFRVYFCTSSKLTWMDCSCAISIDGVMFHSADLRYGSQKGNIYFTHKQLQLADHKNGIFDVVFKVIFPPIHKIRMNSVEFTILECQLEDNEVGEFDSTDKKFAEGSDKHQWRLLYFPAGDSIRSKGHISLIVEASTTETKPVIMSGVIKIIGTSFEKKFNMLVEEDSNRSFSKLISHEELHRIGGIINSKITITCDASFKAK